MSDSLTGSIESPLSLRRTPRAVAVPVRASARPRGQWPGRPLVIGEGLFKDVLIREQKRSNRFEESFVLVVVSCRDRQSDASMWKRIVKGLSAAKRDTDVLGWLEEDSAIGLIVPELGGVDASFARDVESRVQASLATVLDADARADLSIAIHRHDGSHSPAADPERDVAAAIPAALHVSVGDIVRSGLKRGLDIAASAALLFLLSPLFALIAILMKLKSPGPIFFGQARVGESGKPFTMFKFRTMHVNNDPSIHQAFVSQFIKAGAPNGGDAGADAPFKIVNDPRVTSIGRILRSTSLDELPQFWNVLRGDMSLVGPRPALRYEVEQYKPWHYRRVLEAKPGITGLWQVSGRSRTTFDDMVRLDLRYAKKSSAWTDIKILLATPRAVIMGKGAH
jgi:lipopolysaccharide/colanic/teichoic acid biosynthesis glycosyltransferase